MNIWILDSSKGITLLFRSYLDFPVKDDLVSGLLTALNQFTIVEFKEPIDSIDMGGYRWVYSLESQYNLLFVAADSKNKTDVEILRSRLNVIKNLFIQEYVIDEANWKKAWTGDLEVFKPFIKEIDRYYGHWQAAENVDLFADFFDIIGVFQQVFNLLKNVISNQIDYAKRDRMLLEIENLYNSFMERMDIKKVGEMDKVKFSKESGFNIFNINPTNCDVFVVKKQIQNLMIQVVRIIKDALGHDLSLNYFSNEKIFSYIFNNGKLLKRLDLEDFLLQLFLLK